MQASSSVTARATRSALLSNPNVIATILLLALSVAAGVYEGKDFVWDFRNHLVFTPFAWLHGRVAEDFLAAGPQMFGNPLAAMPLFGLISAGLSDRTIVGLLSLFHGFDVVVVFLIARGLAIGDDARTQFVFAGIAALLALLAPIFLGVLGSPFVDAIVALPLLGSILVLSGSTRGHATRVLVSGLLAGISVGLKLSMAPLALAIAMAFIVLLVTQRIGWRAAAREFILWGTASAAGWLLIDGWPMYVRASELGNPLYPFFYDQLGGVAKVTSGIHYRFLPDRVADWLLRPFLLATPYSYVVSERRMPDLRPLALCVFLLVALLRMAFIHARTLSFNVTSPINLGPASSTADRRLLLMSFIGLSWMLWLATSGNGRYAIPLFLLIGPAVVLACWWATRSSKFALTLLGVIATVQAFAVLEYRPQRWAPVSYRGAWFEVKLPQRLRTQPFGFVLTSLNSDSFIFPAFHPNSRFFGLIGQYAMPPTGPGSEMWVAFRQRFADRLFVLAQDFAEDEALPRFIQEQQSLLYRYGMKVEHEGCERIEVPTVTPDDARLAGGHAGLFFRACPLKYVGVAHDPLEADRAEIDTVFDHIEDACPRWFSPQRVDSRMRNLAWYRRYSGTDMLLAEVKGRISFMREAVGPFGVDLGTRADWLGPNPPRLNCDHLPKQYEANSRNFNPFQPTSK